MASPLSKVEKPRQGNLLFAIERRQVIGEVRDGGKDSPIRVALSIIADTLENDETENARRLGSQKDEVQFDYQGHTFTVGVWPTRPPDEEEWS